VYIDRISLRNLRGFEELRFSLDRGKYEWAGWTVFTGDNGSGKSTLLKAIALALAGKDAALALQPNFNRWIRDGAGQGHVELNMVYDREDVIVGQGRTPASTSFKARISFRNGGRETVLEAVDPSFARRSIWATDARGWFSCGYGPFRRVFGASSDTMRAMVAPSTERFVTMFQEAASLAEVDQWLRSLKHKELESKLDERTQLELVLSILGDDLLPNQIEVDRVDSDGLWLRDRNGVQLAWSEMSDGYRAAVALLADILRHMIKAYGVSDLARRDANGRLIVSRSGVVPIDEIDAHLHPEWQRQIGP
jgi:predicted ATP-binding protein involved in virulence